MMLCTLSDVKTLLDIDSEDTTQDAKLTLLIKGVSAKIESYLGYKLERSTYTDEVHSVNNMQLLQLNAFPVRTVAAVTHNGEAVTDYRLIPEYTRWGRLYRAQGWGGAVYTRTFTHDVVSGAYDYTVSYEAGYYLPGDENYSEGADDSLPYDIYSACLKTVAVEYSANKNGSYGLKSHSEGGISDTFGDDASSAGLSDSAKSVLAKYVYYGVA